MRTVSACTFFFFFIYLPITADALRACTEGPPTTVGQPCELKLAYLVRDENEARGICERHWPRAVSHVSFDTNGIICGYETTFECKDASAHLIYDTCFTKIQGKKQASEAISLCTAQGAELPVLYGKQHLKFVSLLAASLNMETIWIGVNADGMNEHNKRMGYVRYNEKHEKNKLAWFGKNGVLQNLNSAVTRTLLRTRSVNDAALPRGYLEKTDDAFESPVLCAKPGIPATTFEQWCKAVNEQLKISTVYSETSCLLLTSNTYTSNYTAAPTLHRKCTIFDQTVIGHASEVDDKNAKVVADLLKKRKSDVRLAGRRRIQPDSSIACCAASAVTDLKSCGDEDFQFSVLNGSYTLTGLTQKRVIHSLCTDFPELPSTLAFSEKEYFFDSPAFLRLPVLCNYGPENSSRSLLVEEGSCTFNLTNGPCKEGLSCIDYWVSHTYENLPLERNKIVKCLKGSPLDLLSSSHVAQAENGTLKAYSTYVCGKDNKWMSTLYGNLSHAAAPSFTCVHNVGLCQANLTLHGYCAAGLWCESEHMQEGEDYPSDLELRKKLSCRMGALLELSDLSHADRQLNLSEKFLCGKDNKWISSANKSLVAALPTVSCVLPVAKCKWKLADYLRPEFRQFQNGTGAMCVIEHWCSPESVVEKYYNQNNERRMSLRCSKGTILDVSDPLKVDTAAIDVNDDIASFHCGQDGNWISSSGKQSLRAVPWVTCVYERCDRSCCGSYEPQPCNKWNFAYVYNSYLYQCTGENPVLSKTLPLKLACPSGSTLYRGRQEVNDGRIVDMPYEYATCGTAAVWSTSSLTYRSDQIIHYGDIGYPCVTYNTDIVLWTNINERPRII